MQKRNQFPNEVHAHLTVALTRATLVQKTGLRGQDKGKVKNFKPKVIRLVH